MLQAGDHGCRVVRPLVLTASSNWSSYICLEACKYVMSSLKFASEPLKFWSSHSAARPQAIALERLSAF